MQSLYQYLKQVSIAMKTKDGIKMSDSFSLRHSHTKNSNLLNVDSEEVLQTIDHHLGEITLLHLKCVTAVSRKDYNEAYSYQSPLVQQWIKLFQAIKDENWLLPVMITVCLDLRCLALKVGTVTSGDSSTVTKPREALEKAAEALMNCFRICTADNRAGERETKKWGMMSFVNQLFKVYFKLNKLNLMKPLIRAIDSSPFKEKFSKAQQITYKYFVGRKATFDSEYALANEYLTYAFEKCHKSMRKNKRLILIYLVPVKLLLGYMPTKAVLEKYDLTSLWEVAEAVKCGRLNNLNRAMEKHQSFFIKSGIYLILEKLKLIAYRNLFKRAYLQVKNHVVPMQVLLAAAQIVDNEPVEMDDVHCLVANMIHSGKIKGYISLAHQKLVLSKVDAFPKLSNISHSN
nr:PREDICTED: PCI domain-containing protein 2 [Bemisia tabaci]